MTRLDLTLLGSFEARLGQERITAFKSNKVRALLAYLASEAYYPHHRESLAELLWPGWPAKSAMDNLRFTLADLRKHIGDRDAQRPFILVSRESMQLNRDADVWVDVREFEQGIKNKGEGIGERGEGEQQSSISGELYWHNLQSAIALYRGPFLEGFSLPDSTSFDEWLLAKRAYFSQQMLKALSRLAEWSIEQGNYEQAEIYACRQIELEPWREQAYQQRMRLLSLKGERVQALAQFESLRKALQRELKVEPSEDTLALYQQIREGTLPPRKQEAAGATVTSGAKEFAGAEALLARPEVVKPPEAEKPFHNLPTQFTSFIGREKEMADVRQLLARMRLLTLSGMGGAGKTRLALEIASHSLGEFKHGVWLVDLAPLNDPDLIASTVVALFGLSQPVGRSLLDILYDYFRNKHLLLILDNCEHLIQQAAQFTEAVLHAAPEVKVLATSHEPLGLAGETVYPVPSLEMPESLHLPPIQSLIQFEAVRLFIERACAALPAFTITELNAPAVVQICRQLDGIPLAIELAAARVRVLSAEQIAARLDDRFRLLTGGSRTALPRHKTLHALLDWSYGLLTEAERVLFRRLSVFHGGWTLEAAEGVCSYRGQEEIEVLDLLEGLVHKSLVDVQLKGGQVQRYRMLDTIRQYAQEKLVEAGEAEQVGDLHLGYFVAFAETMEKKLESPAYLEALEQLDAEIDNHRAALGWALGEGGYKSHGSSRTAGQITHAAQGSRLATALARHWNVRCMEQEGGDWINKNLAILGEEVSLAPLRAKAYLQAGCQLHHYQSTISIIQQLCKKSLDLYRKCDDPLGLARALIAYGSRLSETWNVTLHPVDVPTGIGLIEEGIAILEQRGDLQALGEAFSAKANIAFMQKDSAAKQRMLEKSYACFETAGNIWACEALKFELANDTLWQGDYQTARRLYEEVLEYSRNINIKWVFAKGSAELGQLAYLEENFMQAETYFQQAGVVYQDIGDLEGMCWSTYLLACAAFRRDQIRRARQLFLESQSLGRKLLGDSQYGDRGTNLFIVLWMGVIADSLEQFALAARFLGAVEVFMESYIFIGELIANREYDRISRKVRSAPDEQTFPLAWSEGRKLTLDQALIEALAFCRQDI